MKHLSTPKTLAAITVALLIAALIGVGGFLRFTQIVEVRNVSDQMVTDVALQLHDVSTEWTAIRRVARLQPGEALSIRHAHHDIRIVVEFDLAGERIHHDQPYVDLWSGEGWRVGIQPNGVLTSGYTR